MYRKTAYFISKFIDKTVCYDIAENKEKTFKEFKDLIETPENFKHRLAEFQMENAIMDRFATEKNNRLIVVMTFMILIMTLVLLFKK